MSLQASSSSAHDNNGGESALGSISNSAATANHSLLQPQLLKRAVMSSLISSIKSRLGSLSDVKITTTYANNPRPTLSHIYAHQTV